MKLSVIMTVVAIAAGCSRVEVEKAEAEKVSVEKAAVEKSVSAWTDDFDAAKSKAAAEGKRILLAFSGSDWCHWCVKLDEEVFSKKEFTDLTASKYVLVLIDSPRDKSRLSEKAKARNPELVRQFGIDGYPCGIVCDANGKELGRIGGYVRGGPAAYFAEMEKQAKR